MSPNLNDIVRQMNTFSADIHGYIASISFKWRYNKRLQMHCFHFLLYQIVRHKLQTCLHCKSVNQGCYISNCSSWRVGSKNVCCNFSNVLKVKVKGYRNESGWCMYKVTIWVMIQLHYRSYNLIFQINFTQDICIWRTLMTLTFHLKGHGQCRIKWTNIYIYIYILWEMSRFLSIL